MEPDLRQTILDLETAFWNAMRDKDGAAAARLCGDTVVATNAMGVSTLSPSKMATMTEEGDWALHSYEFDDVQVATPAPNVAIIAYTVRQNVTMGGKSSELRAADSSTWVRGDGGWECHAHSETFLDDKKAA